MPDVNVAIVYYSATGTVFDLAEAARKAAEAAGAEVRLRKVRELAPQEAIDANQGWSAHALRTQDVPEATLDDLEWADVILLGAPTRYGLPAAQLKQFLDQTGGLWAKGALADKVGTAFTSASTGHGGLEVTTLSIDTVLYHWGSLVMPVGYTGEAASALGNPYGASWVSRKGAAPDDTALATAHHQGRRLARFAAAVATVRTG
jgi:NAD(P)H dehydrogenase (quinone)